VGPASLHGDTLVSTLVEGTRIGRYKLGTQLGQGAFGVVYAARDTELDREVALKVLLPLHTLEPQLMQRFFHEAKAAAKIDHPSIVTIYEFGKVAGTSTTFDGSAYIAMEMVRGESLAARLRRVDKLPAAQAIELGRQIASAVGAAHRAGIIHRDLKPDNLMVARDPIAPGGERIKILDFGIAKLGEAAKRETMKTVGAFGTPLYMSPEQFRAASDVDARSDVYALGCILFELATGKPPFDGDDVIALYEQHTKAIRVPIPELPPHISDFVVAMMAAAPADRPRSMEEVEAALAADRAAGSLIASAPTVYERGMAPRPIAVTTLSASAGASLGASDGDSDLPSSSHRRWLASGAVVAAAAIVVTWFGLHGSRESSAPLPRPMPAAEPASPTTSSPPIAADRAGPVAPIMIPTVSAPPPQVTSPAIAAPVVAPIVETSKTPPLAHRPHVKAVRTVSVSAAASPPAPAPKVATAPATAPPTPPVTAAPAAPQPVATPVAPAHVKAPSVRDCGTNDPLCAFGGS
jgi:serine/threonine protein kinase